ncbi:radical SAM protein [Bacteriovorax sp. DB6_IX]|uniref:radical SAM protein n=1 Tax=Bacteriovorax sp. DB6_IX TaxID=1353530 RepID=UPI00038A0383|nr:radical SAM protein [Bacteriovorax sp. DB6_IX]EQC51954.1 radical SAM domain protein [Bacteriovorax sp. DB6_IX]
MLNPVELPQHYNYIGVFLSLACNLSCSYCINHTVGLDQKRRHLSGKEWVDAINRIQPQDGTSISLQGGEPSIHKDFYYILQNIRTDLNIDLLTNIQFDPYEFIERIPTSRFNHDLPYPSIRVSYHPETMDLGETVEKVLILKKAGYPIGIFTVDHPISKAQTEKARIVCHDNGIIFKTKELLGKYDGQLFGTYKYDDAIFAKELKTVQCRTSELLISPEGNIFRCHHDLYNKKMPIGDILDNDFKIEDIYRECKYYGMCNPCDVKLKNNRHQEFGHCSVDIKF